MPAKIPVYRCDACANTTGDGFVYRTFKRNHHDPHRPTKGWYVACYPCSRKVNQITRGMFTIQKAFTISQATTEETFEDRLYDLNLSEFDRDSLRALILRPAAHGARV